MGLASKLAAAPQGQQPGAGSQPNTMPAAQTPPAQSWGAPQAFPAQPSQQGGSQFPSSFTTFGVPPAGPGGPPSQTSWGQPPPVQQQQQWGQSGGYPPQQPSYPPQQQPGGFGAYPPQQQPQQWGAPQQAQYPGMQQPGFGAPAQQQQPPIGQQGQAGMQQALHMKLAQIVQVNQLQAFYPPQRLEQLATRLLSVDFDQLAKKWRLPKELALDLAALALYDVVMYCDDSSSMKFVDNGERIDDLNAIVERVTEVATLFDQDGISVRYMNSNAKGDHLTSPAQAQHFVKTQSNFEGMTPMGKSLDKKIIQPILLPGLRNNSLQKPILVITVTDGEPTSEPETHILKVIRNVQQMCAQSRYGPKAIAFQFAQVGRDTAAQEFLARLDKDQTVGGIVDVTSYYELEAEEMARKGVTLTPELWLVKLMCGAVDPSYDEQD